MIIVNGFIEVKEKTKAGGLDPETGYPVEAEFSWGDPIPCQYLQASHNKLAQVEGEPVTDQTYQILIEEQPFHAAQIRLSNLRKKEIGEFSVKQVEHLRAVAEISITV